MSDPLVCVARVDGPFALALVMSKLGGAGIWSTADIFHTATNYSHASIALGGARIQVLPRDAAAAAALLADGPPMVSSGVRGWRAVLVVLIALCATGGAGPFAVYLQRVPEAVAKIQQSA